MVQNPLYSAILLSDGPNLYTACISLSGYVKSHFPNVTVIIYVFVLLRFYIIFRKFILIYLNLDFN